MSDGMVTLEGLMVGERNLYEDVVRENLENRTLIFNQDVSDDIIEDYVMRIWGWNMEDVSLRPEARKPITLLINSRGGDMYSAYAMMDIVLQSLTPVRAVGLGIVASAAYLIYFCCAERYSFENTVYLQHDGAVGVEDSARKAKDTMAFYDRLAGRDKEIVLSRTTMPEEIYKANEDRELYMYADEAQKYGIVQYIIGKDAQIADVLL